MLGLFFGSSRITGKDALDLHEKELAIPVTVRHSLDDLYSIVYPFQLTGVHRPANPAHDAPPVALRPMPGHAWAVEGLI
jgi:hypothetical protein